MRRIAAAMIAIALIVSMFGCTTVVHIDSEPSGARVSVNGVPTGKTPYTQEMSDFIFNSYDVLIELDGYIAYSGNLKKEFKADAFIAGWFLGFWPWLWTTGPKPAYYFELVER